MIFLIRYKKLISCIEKVTSTRFNCIPREEFTNTTTRINGEIVSNIFKNKHTIEITTERRINDRPWYFSLDLQSSKMSATTVFEIKINYNPKLLSSCYQKPFGNEKYKVEEIIHYAGNFAYVNVHKRISNNRLHRFLYYFRKNNKIFMTFDRRNDVYMIHGFDKTVLRKTKVYTNGKLRLVTDIIYAL